jgi:hypothetical protein
MRAHLVAVALVTAAVLPAQPAAAADERQLIQVSRSVTGGNELSESSFGGATPDGAHVYFMTSEPLVPEDNDALIDAYDRNGETLTLVSRAEGTAALADQSAGFVAVSPDASSVVLASNDPLAPEDDDSSADLYVRRGGHTQLLTAPQGTDPLLHISPSFGCISDDGSRIFFFTGENLLPEDGDPVGVDMYEWHDGQLALVTTGPAGGDSGIGTGGIGGGRICTRDGTKVFFETRESLVAQDSDDKTDIYMRSAGTTTLVTTTQTATPGDTTFRQMTTVGSHVFFETDEALTAADTDVTSDVYMQAVGAPPTLVSIGPQAGATALDAAYQRGSDDGTRVYFTTAERLVPADSDDFQDIYQWHDGVTTIEDHGPTGGSGGPDDIVFSDATADGTRMWFTTHERLTGDDTDFATDVYERYAGVTRRVSIAPINDNGPYGAHYAGATGDGSRIVFQSDGQMTVDDLDAKDDLFERAGGATRRLTGGTQNVDPIYRGRSGDLQHVFFTSGERLLPFDTDDDVDVFESLLVATPDPPADGGGAEGSPSPPAEGVGPGPGPETAAPKLTSSRAGGVVAQGGRINVVCSIDSGALDSCAVDAILDHALRAGAAKAIRIGAGRVDAGGGKRATVSVRLTRSGLRQLRGARRASRIVLDVRASPRGQSAPLQTRLVARVLAPGTLLVPPRGFGARWLRATARDLSGARLVRCECDGRADAIALRRARLTCTRLKRLGVRARLVPARARASSSAGVVLRLVR